MWGLANPSSSRIFNSFLTWQYPLVWFRLHNNLVAKSHEEIYSNAWKTNALTNFNLHLQFLMSIIHQSDLYSYTYELKLLLTALFFFIIVFLYNQYTHMGCHYKPTSGRLDISPRSRKHGMPYLVVVLLIDILTAAYQGHTDLHHRKNEMLGQRFFNIGTVSQTVD